MIFSPQERYIIKGEEQNEKIEELESLRNILLRKLTEKSLRCKSQFPFLDNDFRISLDYLEENFPDEVEDEVSKVKSVEKSFSNQVTLEALRGEIVELAKTLFQEELFNQQFIIFRTSKFDDYFNHVDEIIFDKQTLTPVAAIDTTIDIKTKEKFFEDLSQGVCVRYTPIIEIDKDGVHHYQGFKFDSNLPKIFLVFNFKDIYQLSQTLISQDNNQKTELARKIRGYVIQELISQANFVLNQKEIPEEMRRAYQNFLETLTKIKEEHHDSS